MAESSMRFDKDEMSYFLEIAAEDGHRVPNQQPSPFLVGLLYIQTIIDITRLWKHGHMKYIVLFYE